MGWEARLRDLILAGGAIVAASGACTSNSEHCCNLSMDPCCDVQCGGAVSSECRAKMQCEAAGGTYGGAYNPSPGVMATTCTFMVRSSDDASTEDAGEDAPALDAGSFVFFVPDATPDAQPAEAADSGYSGEAGDADGG
jgi:hypothetical protein